MAGSKLTCPECEAVLKFAKPIAPGKSVRCSKCDTVFKAPAADDDEEPAEKVKTKAKKGSDKDKVTSKKPSGKGDKAGAKEGKSGGDEEDKHYGVMAEDTEAGTAKEDKSKAPKISYAQDTSIKDLRGPAQALVITPTNMMLLFDALGFFGYVGLFIALMIPIVTPLSSDVGSSQTSTVTALEIPGGIGLAGQGGMLTIPGKEDSGELQLFLLFGTDLGQIAFFNWYQIFLYLLPLVLGALYSLVAILGAVKAQNLESRGWGIASAIMMILPIMIAGFTVDMLLFLNFALGVMLDQASIDYILTGLAVIIPLVPVGVGVWALIVFFKADVKAGFEYVPD